MGRVALWIAGVACAVVGLAAAAQAVPPGRPGLIAFENFNGEDYDLYVVRASGGGLRNITRTPDSDEHEPSWSPDSRRIAFAAAEAGDLNTAIFVMNSNGTDRRKLVGGGYWQRSPAWSPDGQWIAFSQCTEFVDGDCSSARIVVVRPSGSGLRAVSRPSPTEWMVDGKPAWSPDGSSIAFTRTPSFAMNSVWVVSANGAGAHKVVDDGSEAEHSPSWSPDGELVVYATDFSGPDAIYVARPDGTRRRRIVFQKALSPEDPGGLATNPAFAPSGAKIVLTFNEDLYTMDASGRKRHRITRDGGDEADWGRAS